MKQPKAELSYGDMFRSCCAHHADETPSVSIGDAEPPHAEIHMMGKEPVAPTTEVFETALEDDSEMTLEDETMDYGDGPRPTPDDFFFTSGPIMQVW